MFLKLKVLPHQLHSKLFLAVSCMFVVYLQSYHRLVSFVTYLASKLYSLTRKVAREIKSGLFVFPYLSPAPPDKLFSFVPALSNHSFTRKCRELLSSLSLPHEVSSASICGSSISGPCTLGDSLNQRTTTGSQFACSSFIRNTCPIFSSTLFSIFHLTVLT